MDILKELEKFSTPIVFDAIEKFGVRARNAGYPDDSIKCIFPDLPPICGYAATAKITGIGPQQEGEETVSFKEVWRYCDSQPKPGIMAVQDIDPEPKRACAWGDYAASIFLAMGYKGVITDGFVRDIDAVKALNFQYFARSAIVGHGYIRYSQINIPVHICGVEVRPGDLLHGDMHGFTVIPKEIPLDDLVRAAKEWLASENKVISYCKFASDFSLEGMFEKIDCHESFGGHML